MVGNPRLCAQRAAPPIFSVGVDLNGSVGIV
jgi:hypothetical protein